MTSEAKESMLAGSVFQPGDSVAEKARKLHAAICSTVSPIPDRVSLIPDFPAESHGELALALVTGRLIAFPGPTHRRALIDDLIRPPDAYQLSFLAALLLLTIASTMAALVWSAWAYAIGAVALVLYLRRDMAQYKRRLYAAALSDELTLCVLYCLRIISFTTRSGAGYWSYSQEAAARFRMTPTALSMPRPAAHQDEVESHLQMIYTNGVRMDSADWGTKEVIAATRRRWPDHPRLPELEKIAYQALMVGWRAATPLDLELAMTGRAQDLRHELQPLIAMARGLLAE